MRDFPMPGSPEISKTRPFPALAFSQHPIIKSVSCSRPTSGVSGVRSALKRLTISADLMTRQDSIGIAKPLSRLASTGAYSKRSLTSCRVSPLITNYSAADYGIRQVSPCPLLRRSGISGLNADITDQRE